ncbi:MAG: hypothetical protein ACOC2U_01485 [bacterium]
MKDIINSEIHFFLQERNFNLKINDLERLNELFFSQEISENNNIDKKNEIVSLIKNNQWINPTPSEFRDSLLKSKHPLMLTDYNESELNQMKLFKLKNYNIGFALKNHDGKPYSEIVAVHNNEPDVSGIGDELMRSAIKNGGCYLDHFDSSKLSSLYSSMGFEEIGRDKYDPQGNFKSKYGTLDVIYRKHKNCS